MNNKEVLMILRYLRQFCEDTSACSTCSMKKTCEENLDKGLWKFTNDCINEIKSNEGESPCIVRL